MQLDLVLTENMLWLWMQTEKTKIENCGHAVASTMFSLRNNADRKRPEDEGSKQKKAAKKLLQDWVTIYIPPTLALMMPLKRHDNCSCQQPLGAQKHNGSKEFLACMHGFAQMKPSVAIFLLKKCIGLICSRRPCQD